MATRSLVETIPEEKEIEESGIDSNITFDPSKSHPNNLYHQQDNSINNVICVGIIIALIDIFVIPIIAIVLAAETLQMRQGNQLYATCLGSEGFTPDCECDVINTCSMEDDDWYTAMEVFAILLYILSMYFKLIIYLILANLR